MNFQEALKLVGLAEGKYTNDPKDPGGETICGLARNKNPDLKIWEILDRWKENGTTSPDELDRLARGDVYFMELVRSVYKGRYWNATECDILPPLLRYPMFSCAVNCGTTTAIKILQRSLGINDDGKFGTETYRACRIGDIKARVERFCDEWVLYYQNLIKARPALKKYENGWYNRVKNVLRDNH